MRVLSSFSDSPRWASHPASRALTCPACCLERQQAAKSSAYLTRAGESFSTWVASPPW
jgi:hypothetical protein